MLINHRPCISTIVVIIVHFDSGNFAHDAGTKMAHNMHRTNKRKKHLNVEKKTPKTYRKLETILKAKKHETLTKFINV